MHAQLYNLLNLFIIFINSIFLQIQRINIVWNVVIIAKNVIYILRIVSNVIKMVQINICLIILAFRIVHKVNFFTLIK